MIDILQDVERHGLLMESTFPVCMSPVRATQPGMHGLHVCPEQPSGCTAFCKEHHSLAQQHGYQCNVKDFLSYCGALKTASRYYLLKYNKVMQKYRH